MREGVFSYFSGPLEREALVEMVRGAMDSPCWDDGIEVLSGTPAWVSLAPAAILKPLIDWFNSFAARETLAFRKPLGNPSLLLSGKYY